MDRFCRAALVVTLTMVCPTPAFAQFVNDRTESAAGVRVGLTFLPQSLTRDVVSSPLSVIGFQAERFFPDNGSGVEIVNEVITLLGMDESRPIGFLSLSWLIGVRSQGGAGFSAGPNLSVGGVGLMLTTGKTFRRGRLNVPVTVAVVPSPKSGSWAMVMTGFSLRSR